jgi:sirohydrochlorin cobaltochelatase
MNKYGYIGRKMRLPQLKEKPAIVIATFGSTLRGRAALDIFRQRLEEAYPEHEAFWAYTSAIIRKKTGLPSLQQTLAEVEAAGFRKTIVQPLHVFPGTEYRQMAETCEYFPGLRIILSETLMHRWDFVKDTLDVAASEFFAPEEGMNLLALHGTPLVADPVTAVHLGLERMVADRYSNVMTASVEGVPDCHAVLAGIKRKKLPEHFKKIKIIPMMYVAGLHVEDDLMGNGKSWRTQLEEMGFTVECPVIRKDGADCFKGLADYPEVISFFLDRLRRALMLVDNF